MKLKAQLGGFTLIELLVVIAIIGLLSTLAVVSLNNARQKSRDAKRVSDIKQIQTSLELYYADKNSYPGVAAATVLGGASAKALSATNGFNAVAAGTTYMGQVPKNPTPGGADYSYISRDGAGAACTDAVNGCASYSIDFTLEGGTGDLALGAHVATPNGLQ